MEKDRAAEGSQVDSGEEQSVDGNVDTSEIIYKSTKDLSILRDPRILELFALSFGGVGLPPALRPATEQK